MKRALVIGLLLLPGVAAIDDPAGDVAKRVGGEPVHAPYIDIRSVDVTFDDDRMTIQMRMDEAVESGPPEARLQFGMPFRFGPDDGSPIFGNQDGSIVCTYEAGTFGCRDGAQDPDATFAVVGAGLHDRNVSATVQVDGQREAAVAGLTSRIVDGNVTAQDFTDNALPYASRPGTTDSASNGPDDEETPGPGLLSVLLGLCVALRQRA